MNITTVLDAEDVNFGMALEDESANVTVGKNLSSIYFSVKSNISGLEDCSQTILMEEIKVKYNKTSSEISLRTGLANRPVKKFKKGFIETQGFSCNSLRNR
jgi:hypothetical protein